MFNKGFPRSCFPFLKNVDTQPFPVKPRSDSCLLLERLIFSIQVLDVPDPLLSSILSLKSTQVAKICQYRLMVISIVH